MTDNPGTARGLHSEVQEGADMVPGSTHSGASATMAQARTALRG
jgi:hypothetical protein